MELENIKELSKCFRQNRGNIKGMALYSNLCSELHRCTGISMRDNLITEVSPVFAENTVLSGLDLSENQITRVDPVSFAPLKALSTLNLSSNPFTNLPAFDGLLRLRDVSLNLSVIF